MLSLGGFPPQPCNTNHRHTFSQFLPSPNITYRTQLAFLSDGLTRHTFCPVPCQLRTKFWVSALKSRSKGGNSFLEMDDFDDNNDQYDDDEDDDGFVPLRNMKMWLEHKPRGFGEDKVYDTSIEEKLVEEMEQSKQAQLANINNLKNSSEKPNSEKGILQKQKAPEVVPSGICVRLVNLPKKKNIHRDLQLAFKGVPGVVNIIPAVSGNKKTRDPICKGFAFIDLKSEGDANRFVQVFSGQSISFGKIQKQIVCEIMNSKSPSPAYEESANGIFRAPQLTVPSLREGPGADFDIDDTSSDSREVIASDKFEGADDERVRAQWEEINENLGSFNLSEHSDGDNMGARNLPSKQQEKIRANKKKLADKRKGTKVPKLNIPGSANRLKIKEKAVLTGVLSKYAVQAASASKEQR